MVRVLDEKDLLERKVSSDSTLIKSLSQVRPKFRNLKYFEDNDTALLSSREGVMDGYCSRCRLRLQRQK